MLINLLSVFTLRNSFFILRVLQPASSELERGEQAPDKLKSRSTYSFFFLIFLELTRLSDFTLRAESRARDGVEKYLIYYKVSSRLARTIRLLYSNA